MSINLNGSTGVTTPGISNSEGYTGDGLTIAAGAPAGALTLNASGRLGVGTSSPSATLDIVAAKATISATSSTGTNAAYSIWANTGGNFYVGLDNSTGVDFAATYAGAIWHGGAYPLLFGTSNVERMRLDASGNLLVGTTSATSSGWLQLISSSTKYSIVSKATASTGSPAGFFNSSGAIVGEISTSASSTAYITSSDYRLKENVQPMTGALDKITALKPVTYNWKVNGSADRGFIAHELQEVIPQAVSGEKDAVDGGGNIMPQGVDYGKITPEIVAAIQELKARIEQLEAKA